MKTITLTTKDADFILKYLRDNLEQLEKVFQDTEKLFGLILETFTSELLTDIQHLSEDFEKAKKEYHTRHEEIEQMILLLTTGSENESRD